ncbi:cell division protein FtsQ/DivIB [Cytobacillus sp. IB215665]|uniref:cell division protein FtsQ/DivIB n=1 Tax=Cytobacillus sp. IB215665 TaxID=3097357 RepID=UPI002A101F14|nr:cell division protein FtsQ/DivIB [Cytobacillus sp. IB215665]MDX8364974.1 cell division protein FtsQ/DivIB [Cytobacillus sp. IB215665]
MGKEKVVVLEDRVPKLKQQRKQKVNRRLIYYILFFFLMIITIVYFQSPLSKVSSISVSGNHHVSTEEIIDLSGVSTKNSFWSVNENSITQSISAHEEIAEVSVQKQFPNKVLILVTETRRIGYMLNESRFYPILENGKSLTDEKQSVSSPDAPVFVNWSSSDDVDMMIEELVQLSDEVSNSISEIHHTPTPSDPLHITLYMNDGFEVSGTITNFSRKMAFYPSIVNHLDPSVKGIIDIEVGSFFSPYNQHKEEQESENQG